MFIFSINSNKTIIPTQLLLKALFKSKLTFTCKQNCIHATWMFKNISPAKKTFTLNRTSGMIIIFKKNYITESIREINTMLPPVGKTSQIPENSIRENKGKKKKNVKRTLSSHLATHSENAISLSSTSFSSSESIDCLHSAFLDSRSTSLLFSL